MAVAHEAISGANVVTVVVALESTLILSRLIAVSEAVQKRYFSLNMHFTGISLTDFGSVKNHHVLPSSKNVRYMLTKYVLTLISVQIYFYLHTLLAHRRIAVLIKVLELSGTIVRRWQRFELIDNTGR